MSFRKGTFERDKTGILRPFCPAHAAIRLTHGSQNLGDGHSRSEVIGTRLHGSLHIGERSK